MGIGNGNTNPATMSDVATWVVAWATVALVVVTLAAVLVGGYALQRANDTYRLESEPLLVVTQHTEPFDATRHVERIVVDGAPALENGITVRRRTPLDDGPDSGIAVRRPMTRVILKVENVGRSPAVAPEIFVIATLPMMRQPDARLVGFTGDGWVTGGFQSGKLEGSGKIIFSAIPAGANALVEIAHYLGVPVSLSFLDGGFRWQWEGEAWKQVAMPVASADAIITLRAPS